MTTFTYSSIGVLLVVFPVVINGFITQQHTFTNTNLPTWGSTCCFIMSNNRDENDNIGDDDDIDPNSLGDWRTFRMNLANTDHSSSSYSSIDGIDLQDTTTQQDTNSIATTPNKKERPKSVSRKNEVLLSSQNSVLAEEYLSGVWAHESSIIEVGGLVCRMPLEAEIYKNTNLHISERLHALLDSNDYSKEDSIPPSISLSSSASTGGVASATNSKSSGIIEGSIDSTQIKDEDEEDDESNSSSSFSPLAAKTTYWYRGAEKLLKSELLKIMSTANVNGKIAPEELDEESLEILQLYISHQDSWQEVALVVEKDEKSGSCTTLTINRPMAFKLSESLGRLVLFGGLKEQGAMINIKESDGVETQNVVKFLSVFENECAVYVGGPDDMDKPAKMIHGINNLDGAVEIASGTGIYIGGLEAAMDGILSGKYKPLDFRFIVGNTKYIGGDLAAAVAAGKYQPVACSRPLVLKQCIQLPKPLYHEVLEFCGGELREISKLELSKRDDLQ